MKKLILAALVGWALSMLFGPEQLLGLFKR
jgi:hypothetical protein